jgi:D-tyrosyl-tRNA(Tyr) deacylase
MEVAQPMRAIVQRVKRGAVSVDGETTGSVDTGLVVLIGATHQDTEAEAQKLAQKIAHLRIFEDDAGKMNLSALDVGAGILVVSQFTLYADCKKGRRPSFTNAAPPEVAEPLIEHFVDKLREAGLARVETGVFRASMLVEIYNDGPVTVILDTDEL